MLICKCQHAFSKGRCYNIRNPFWFDTWHATRLLQNHYEKSNKCHATSLSWLWHTISSSWMLCHNLLEYLKLAKIINILVFQSVENRKCFLIMKLLKSNLHNKLGPNLPIVVRIFWQHFFTLVQFLYKNAIEFWKNETKITMMFSFIIYPFEFSHFVD